MGDAIAGSRRHVGWRIGLCLVTLSIGCGEIDPGPEMEEGVSEELARHRKVSIRDLRYTYELSVPRDDGALTGTMVARFTLQDESGGSVVVDFKEPRQRVRSVLVNGVEAAWTPEFDHVVVHGSAFSTHATNELRIDFVAGDEALNRNPDFLYTLFVPDRAHFSLPIFDQPDLKAPFSLTLDIPAEWVAVANGAEVASAPSGEGRTRYTFSETQPIASYLFAFAVGDFQIVEAERGGRKFRMFHRETDSAKVTRNSEAVFDLHQIALDWLEDYTGIDYPFGKFDFVLLPPFQYGGMEHPGSIFYRQSSLLLEETATQQQIIGRASLIAHETAHQWFGDLVTMAWFDDVWTKEVFANFMAAKIVHPSFPELDHDLRFFLAHHNTAYAVDRTAGANPIRQPLENLRGAGTLYGAIIYQKAPIVMRQLEILVGEESFRDGMREYLTTFAHGNATWLELVAILDPRTEENLVEWSRVWVEEAGRPTISTEVTLSGGRVQKIEIVQNDPAERGRSWRQFLSVTKSESGVLSSVPTRLGAGAFLLNDWVGHAPPDFILPNGGGYGYGHFHLDDRSRRYLLEFLPEISDAMTRGVAWVTLWDAFLEGEVVAEQWLDLLLRGVREESEEQNLQRIFGYLGTTFWRFTDEENRRVRAPIAERLLWQGLEDAQQSTVRSAYFNAWRSVVSTAEGVSRLQRIWSKNEAVAGMNFSVADYTRMATTLAILWDGDTEELLDRQMERIENPDRRARFTFVRDALSSNPRVREEFFEELREENNRKREPWVLAALGYLHHPTRTAHSKRFVLPSLELLEEIQRTGDIFFPQRWLGATLGSHNDPRLAAEVRSWVDGLSPDYPQRLLGKILQSTDGLDRSSRIVYGTDP